MKEVKLTILKDGFIEPVLMPEDYISDSKRSIQTVLGAVEEVIRPDGQWDAFLPSDEIQVGMFETFNCTAFALTSVVEILIKQLYGE